MVLDFCGVFWCGFVFGFGVVFFVVVVYLLWFGFWVLVGFLFGVVGFWCVFFVFSFVIVVFSKTQV